MVPIPSTSVLPTVCAYLTRRARSDRFAPNRHAPSGFSHGVLPHAHPCSLKRGPKPLHVVVGEVLPYDMLWSQQGRTVNHTGVVTSMVSTEISPEITLNLYKDQLVRGEEGRTAPEEVPER